MVWAKRAGNVIGDWGGWRVPRRRPEARKAAEQRGQGRKRQRQDAEEKAGVGCKGGAREGGGYFSPRLRNHPIESALLAGVAHWFSLPDTPTLVLETLVGCSSPSAATAARSLERARLIDWLTASLMVGLREESWSLLPPPVLELPLSE